MSSPQQVGPNAAGASAAWRSENQGDPRGIDLTSLVSQIFGAPAGDSNQWGVNREAFLSVPSLQRDPFLQGSSVSWFEGLLEGDDEELRSGPDGAKSPPREFKLVPFPFPELVVPLDREQAPRNSGVVGAICSALFIVVLAVAQP